jgi:hypothetical protein
MIAQTLFGADSWDDLTSEQLPQALDEYNKFIQKSYSE